MRSQAATPRAPMEKHSPAEWPAVGELQAATWEHAGKRRERLGKVGHTGGKGWPGFRESETRGFASKELGNRDLRKTGVACLGSAVQGWLRMSYATWLGDR
jgi:hypothetical protein